MTRSELRALTKRMLGSPIPAVVGLNVGDDTAAAGTSGTVNDNNALTWTAVSAGEDGNKIAIILDDPGASGQALSITVHSYTIIVSLATDGNSALTTTAAALRTAIAADDDAAALVTVANTGASNGTGIVADASVLMSGGVNASTTALNEYINDAIREMSGHVGGVEDTDTITLVTSTRLYALPTRFVGEIDVRYVEDTDNEVVLKKIVRLSDRPADYRDETDEPSHYYFEGNQFGFYPFPSSSENNDTIRINGWFEAEDLATDSAEPDWPRSWHRCIALLAAAVICEAQSRAEAQSANSDISADTVQQDARSRMYAFRAAELRKMYEHELRRVRGIGRL